MKFLDNLPGQLIALTLGWAFTLYLQNRVNRRTEAIKRKDKLVDKIEALSGWIDQEVKKEKFDPNLTESAYTARISQIEIRATQLNRHIGTQILDTSSLSKLRDVDFFCEQTHGIPYLISEAAADIIENIEESCDEIYFKNKGFLEKLNSIIHELKGIAFALLVILMTMWLGFILTTK